MSAFQRVQSPITPSDDMSLSMTGARQADGSWERSTAVRLQDRSFLENAAESEFDELDELEADEYPQLKLSILMCAFNEQQTISRAVREVLTIKYPCEIELIVVDDGSSDATAALVSRVKDSRVILYRHPENRGKGAALRTAVSLATGTHVLPFDADLEYTPKDIPRLIEPVLTGRFDVVYGARLFGYNTVYQSFRYAVGNRMLTTMTNVLFDSYLSDMHTCLKLVPLGIFSNLVLREDGFGLDTELTAILLRLGIRPFEVPVSYYSRSHAQGKKINWRDAVACLRILLRVRAARKRRLVLPTAEVDVSGKTALRAKKEQPSCPGTLPGLAALDEGDRGGEQPNAITAGLGDCTRTLRP